MVEQFFGFGNAGGDTERRGRRKIRVFGVVSHDHRLCQAHQPNGDTGGFSDPRIPQVQATIDGGAGDPEIALTQMPQAVDSGSVFGLQQPFEIRRNYFTRQQERRFRSHRVQSPERPDAGENPLWFTEIAKDAEQPDTLPDADPLTKAGEVGGFRGVLRLRRSAG